MVDRDEIGLGADAIDDQLLLIERLPEREVEPDDATRADGELMGFHDVVAVLVERHRVDAAECRNRCVVRHAGDGVAALLVGPHDFLVALLSVGHAAPGVPDRGKGFVNDIEASPEAAATKLGRGDRIRVWMDRPGSARSRTPSRSGDLHILYEDEVLIVLDKPAGLLAVPLERKEDEDSVVDQLVTHLRPQGKRKPLVVHRIDRDTSGLVVFAKTAAAQRALREQFKRHSVERVYRAVVYGHPDPPSGVWRDRLVWDGKALIQKETHPRDPKGKDAVCRYETLEKFEGTSLIEV